MEVQEEDTHIQEEVVWEFRDDDDDEAGDGTGREVGTDREEVRADAGPGVERGGGTEG